MLVTANEAYSTRCPYTGRNCIAYDCMAWRWVEKSKVAFNPSRVHAGGWVDAPKEQWRGYCGLAGKPEEA